MNTRAAHHRNTPVRYTDPKYTAFRREIQLHPFPGEPAKYAGFFFLPDLVVKQSGIANAGYGLFLLEDVYPGQVLTMYSRSIISEKTAKILKEQVLFKLKRLHIMIAAYSDTIQSVPRFSDYDLVAGESSYPCESCVVPLPGFQNISSKGLRLLCSPP